MLGIKFKWKKNWFGLNNFNNMTMRIEKKSQNGLAGSYRKLISELNLLDKMCSLKPFSNKI